MDIKRIVLTGGHCAGKTTGIAILRDRLASLWYMEIEVLDIEQNISLARR